MGKFSSLEGRSIPPFLPINWADWDADEHVEQMNETMQGVYFLIIKELWKYDAFEFDYKVLSGRIRAKDYRNVKRFLETWGHLFRCVECDSALTPRWGHAGTTLVSCRYCAGITLCSCGGHAGFAYHRKLRNYKNNAISGVGLGTIQQNTNEGKLTKDNNAEGVRPSSSFVHKPKATPSLTEGEKTTAKTPPAAAPPPVPVADATSTVAPALADIREWNEPRFSVSAERLRNCIIYQLDHATNPYLRKSGITVASMEHPKFVAKLDTDTPAGWSPNAPKPAKAVAPSAYQFKNKGI